MLVFVLSPHLILTLFCVVFGTEQVFKFMQLDLSWLDLNTHSLSSRSFQSTQKRSFIHMKQLNNEEV